MQTFPAPLPSSSRARLGAAAAFLLGALVAAVVAGCAGRRPAPPPAEVRPVGVTLSHVHRVDVLAAGPADETAVFGAGAVDPRLTMRSPAVLIPRVTEHGYSIAELEFPVFESAEGFHDAMLSWNVRFPSSEPDPEPRGLGVWFEVRVCSRAPGARDPAWSPWMLIGEWGGLRPDDIGQPVVTTFEHGAVEVDIVRSRETLHRVQHRVVAASLWPGSVIDIDTLVLTTTRIPRPEGAAIVRGPFTPGPAVALPVPFRSQKTPDPALAGRLCSPTSVAMATAFLGAPGVVADVAALAFHPRSNLFGVWPRNVQAGFVQGFPGVVRRYSRWDDVERTIRAGYAVVISIMAKPGQLANAPYAETGGHLLIIRGFDSRGDVLVSDPAVSTAAKGELTYSREDLTTVWMINAEGTSYVFWEPPAGAAP